MFYNNKRRRGANKLPSPLEHEEQFAKQLASEQKSEDESGLSSALNLVKQSELPDEYA
jgi:hypothetical protein